MVRERLRISCATRLRKIAKSGGRMSGGRVVMGRREETDGRCRKAAAGVGRGKRASGGSYNATTGSPGMP